MSHTMSFKLERTPLAEETSGTEILPEISHNHLQALTHAKSRQGSLGARRISRACKKTPSTTSGRQFLFLAQQNAKYFCLSALQLVLPLTRRRIRGSHVNMFLRFLFFLLRCSERLDPGGRMRMRFAADAMVYCAN